MFAAVIVLASGVSLLSQGACAQWWDLPDGIDNPRPRYYDYHPPGVFYGGPGPVGFTASEFLVAPNAASPAPAYGGAGLWLHGPLRGAQRRGSRRSSAALRCLSLLAKRHLYR
jgi:hypothetical protein